jgi:ubiquinone/menaquinone biosynthesis C-methylase UbiE
MTPQGAYNAVASTYDKAFTDRRALAEDLEVFSRIARLGPQFVLDVGCGTGLFLDRTGLAADRYIGIDSAENMIARARAKYPNHQFIQLFAESIPLRFQASLAVSLFGSFSYFDGPTALRAIYNVLVPGGRLVLMAYGQQYEERPSYILKRYGIVAPRKLYYARELYELVKAAGFRDVQVSGVTWRADRLPNALPLAAHRAAHRLERTTVCRTNPDDCWFRYVEATRG